MNPFEGDYKVDGQMSFDFTEKGSGQMKQDRFKAEEPRMVQYAREYAEKKRVKK